MNVYFGKIAPKNKEQIDGHYYRAPKNWPGYSGLSDGDYVYMLCEGVTHLWRALPYDDEKGIRPFEVVLPSIGNCTAFLAHIKYLKLSMDLAVKSHRQTKGVAFFKLDVDPNFSEEKLVDSQTYKNADTFRNIVVREDKDSIEPDSYDLQFYFEEGFLKCASPKFSDESYYKDFRDNLSMIGGNRPKKDKILKAVKDVSNIDKEFDYNSDLDLLKVYDAFMVDYKAREDDVSGETRFWCFNHNYSGCDAKGFRNFKEWAYANKSCKMQQEFEIDKQNVKRNWQNACCIKPGDVIFFRAGDVAYAYGFAVEPRKKGHVDNFVEISAQDIIKEKSSGEYCSQKGYRGYVFFNDAEVFYEDFSDGDWGQRVDVEEWFSPEDDSFVNVQDKSLYKDKNVYLTIKEVKPDEAKKIMELLGYEKIVKPDDEFLKDLENLLKIKKNIILQGAPGTGKTYKTAELALSVIGELPTRNVDEDEKSFHKRIIDAYGTKIIKLNRNGSIVNTDAQIGFVTFHQSMDYEDFVEGIKPAKPDEGEMYYKIEDGIFKIMSRAAANPQQVKQAKSIDSAFDDLIQDINDGSVKNLPMKNGGSSADLSVSSQWTIKWNTRNGNIDANCVSKDRLLKLCEFYDSKEKLGAITNIDESIRNVIGGCNSSYYWAVANYILEKIGEENISSEKIRNYVLIIDEINRGNVSKIFGELISLLEADKRVGGDHPLTVTLPYSKEPFSVPSNLYIIGTMNTTDRSVGSIDYAVRRRFAFVTLEANENLVPEGDARNLFNAVKKFLNESKYDMDIEDLMVGHSYFMDSGDLQMKWQYEILPLLMEYHKDGIISKSPLKDKSGNEIEDVKKNYTAFISAWQKKESEETEA